MYVVFEIKMQCFYRSLSVVSHTNTLEQEIGGGVFEMLHVVLICYNLTIPSKY